MMNIYDITNAEARLDFPLTFRFLTSEFSKFVDVSMENAQVADVLIELCSALKSLASQPMLKRDKPIKKDQSSTPAS